MIAIIDYGAGNLRSIRRALEAAGAEVTITRDPAVVEQAEGVVLPGVGAAAHAMERLTDLELVPAIHRVVDWGTPFLGICLGMQVLFGHQEEGDSFGLNILKGRVRGLRSEVKIPHMGWNVSKVVQDGPIGREGDQDFFYFVHSYVTEPDSERDVVAATEYGEVFPSVVARDNVWGMQFHPEKSGPAGLRLIDAFVATVRTGSEQARETTGSR